MKKMFKFSLLSTTVLVSAVSFTACSSNDDVENNPNYDPVTNAVKTEFVINVTQPGERSRMTAGDAGAGLFQGINNMNLFCYADVPATVNTMDASNKLTLSSYTRPAIDGGDPTLTNSSSKVYTMYIPVGTSNFLFYATALSSVGDKFAKGSLTNNLSTASTVLTTPSADTDIKFSLEPIVSSESEITTLQAKLLSILNGIKDAKIDDTNTWASLSNTTNVHMKALGNAFNQFTNQAQGGDVRQGSSSAILNMVSDLCASVIDVYKNESDVQAKALAEKILDKIAEYFDVTKTGTATPYTYTWNNNYKTGGIGETFINNSFPESLNLPTGSAVITYSNENGFAFVNNGQMGTATVSTAFDNFTYPSQLTYYCNSALWQTNVGKNTSDYPTNSTAWITEGNWSGWTSTPVSAATRAVAMKENITYGAAQLISTIKLGEGVGTTTNALEDNANNVTGGVTANNVFDGTSDAKTINLKVHGMLIGGQPANSRYDYLPLANNASKVIYDKISDTGTALTTDGATNYTLVMDNYTTESTQSSVNIAFEMTADKDFYGASGKIKSGQKFYLIGSLNPADGGDITWADHKSFDTTDTGYDVNRVFIRDAKTVATFTLQKNCLKNAYSTIPDLRSIQMLFGISVDLAWKAGLTFNVNIGE
jgi:hypothetical protein